MSDDTIAALQKLSEQIADLSRRVEAATEAPKARHADEGRLTPAHIQAVTFVCSRLKPGYVPEQVDEFLDRIAEELARVIDERDEARAQLAALQGGGSTA